MIQRHHLHALDNQIPRSQKLVHRLVNVVPGQLLGGGVGSGFAAFAIRVIEIENSRRMHILPTGELRVLSPQHVTAVELAQLRRSQPVQLLRIAHDIRQRFGCAVFVVVRLPNPPQRVFQVETRAVHGLAIACLYLVVECVTSRLAHASDTKVFVKQ